MHVNRIVLLIGLIIAASAVALAAIGDTINANPSSPWAVTLTSAKSDVVIANTDATTATSGAALYDPLNSGGTTILPVRLGANATRVMLRARITSATTAVATSPVVRVYAIWGGNSEDWTTGIMGRIDTNDVDATGLTLSLPASPSTTNMTSQALGATTYRYGDWVSLDGTDCKGADAILVVVETAASITGGACDVQVAVLN